ncbi:MAG: hypothetical protein HKP27_11645 [Myxococcales bacterium]|nr:hypothetical protein [Myxococcales bacterium]
MREALEAIASSLEGLRRPGEDFAASLYGEISEFARFSQGRPHQIGSVEQIELDLRWIVGRRQARLSLALSGNPADDRARVGGAVAKLREVSSGTSEDPYLLLPERVHSSERTGVVEGPDGRELLAVFCELHRGTDAVGVMAAGSQFVGFANGAGQRNWHSVHSHHFDWSLHDPEGRAVKASHAGFRFDAEALARRVELAKREQSALRNAAKTLSPGRFRVFLAPDAMAEILGLIGWEGFSIRAQKTRATPLRRLVEGEAALHASVEIGEDTENGLAPNFDALGFPRPGRVDLVAAGRHAGALVSPRSAAEYGIPTNGASDYESPLSLDLSPGTLSTDAALEELGTGIYVSNLWYSNFSDRNACRTTGMTRFATLWVENGRPVAPVAPMRFDDTLYRMLGDNLVALTAERSFLPDPGTYGRRSLCSTRLPGALIDDFTLTL